jgi:hypothetical protein
LASHQHSRLDSEATTSNESKTQGRCDRDGDRTGFSAVVFANGVQKGEYLHESIAEGLLAMNSRNALVPVLLENLDSRGRLRYAGLALLRQHFQKLLCFSDFGLLAVYVSCGDDGLIPSTPAPDRTTWIT